MGPHGLKQTSSMATDGTTMKVTGAPGVLELNICADNKEPLKLFVP